MGVTGSIPVRSVPLMSHAVDFKTVSTVGLESSPVADALAPKFKFARQKSRLAGTIRGSYFAFTNEY